MQRKFLVGLTGGIGSGKSAAADRFGHHNIKVVDADIASRVVVEPGRPALTAIADHFGANILQSDGTLNRAQLRTEVFSEPKQRHWLQSLLHPLITEYLHAEITSATSTYVVLVNPLLLETKQNSWCNRVLVIDVPESVQIERTMARDNNSLTQVESIMAAQLSRDARLSEADDIIINNQDLPFLHKEVDNLHTRYIQQQQQQQSVADQV